MTEKRTTALEKGITSEILQGETPTGTGITGGGVAAAVTAGVAAAAKTGLVTGTEAEQEAEAEQAEKGTLVNPSMT